MVPRNMVCACAQANHTRNNLVKTTATHGTMHCMFKGGLSLRSHHKRGV